MYGIWFNSIWLWFTSLNRSPSSTRRSQEYGLYKCIVLKQVRVDE